MHYNTFIEFKISNNQLFLQFFCKIKLHVNPHKSQPHYSRYAFFFWNPHLYDEHISLKRQHVCFPWVFFLSNDDLYNLDFITKRWDWQTRRINLIIQTIHRRSFFRKLQNISSSFKCNVFGNSTSNQQKYLKSYATR